MANHMQVIDSSIPLLFIRVLLVMIMGSLIPCIHSRNVNVSVSGDHLLWDELTRGVAEAVSTSGMNTIDACWRGDENWADNRKSLADCAIGFGGGATGGKAGQYYVVTDNGDDAQNPAPGTLRYGVIQLRPLWIYFAKDMRIVLENELIFTSDKTLDGRGADVEIAYGPCLTLQYVSNVIIHGINIHHCTPGKPGRVRSSTTHIGYRRGSDGDAISIFGSNTIWIDHNSLSSCADGLIDIIRASTAITISNNFFSHHDKVMLLGHSDTYKADKNMKVSIAFNHFGAGLIKRMPRCRFGVVHIAHNDYDGWQEYAIGGSLHPTIISAGNRFMAPSTKNKEVTKRERTKRWKSWVWKSVDDTFENGAYFRQSGPTNADTSQYGLGVSTKYVASMTSSAGPLSCSTKSSC